MTDSEHVGKTCQIDVLIEEHDERTRAKARLSWAGRQMVGVGLARLDPADEPVAQIGDELRSPGPCRIWRISYSL